MLAGRSISTRQDKPGLGSLLKILLGEFSRKKEKKGVHRVSRIISVSSQPGYKKPLPLLPPKAAVWLVPADLNDLVEPAPRAVRGLRHRPAWPVSPAWRGSAVLPTYLPEDWVQMGVAPSQTADLKILIPPHQLLCLSVCTYECMYVFL